MEDSTRINSMRISDALFDLRDKCEDNSDMAEIINILIDGLEAMWCIDKMQFLYHRGLLDGSAVGDMLDDCYHQRQRYIDRR